MVVWLYPKSHVRHSLPVEKEHSITLILLLLAYAIKTHSWSARP